MMLKSKWSKVLSLLIALLQLALTGYFITQFNANGSYNFITNIAWFAGAGINFKLGIDGMSMLLLLLTNLSIPLILYATNDRNYSQNGSYYALVLLMQMALNGVFMALDGMVFYIFWELALIPIYFIFKFSN